MDMINKNLNLVENIFDEDKLEKAKTRDGYGKGLVVLGEKNPNVVVLCADLSESTRSEWFQQKFPDRFIECGVAEQGMATYASGMAAAGEIAFLFSYCAFFSRR